MENQILAEYLERYAGDEYVYYNTYDSFDDYTIIFKIMEKTKIQKYVYKYDYGVHIVNNCEVIDIICHSDVGKEVKGLTEELFYIDSKHSYYEFLKIGDYVSDSVHVYVMKDLDKYIDINIKSDRNL